MRYQYWLARLSGIGNATKRRLLKRFRSCEAVYQADREAYQKSGILRAQAAEYVETQKNLWDLDGEYERFLEKKIALLTMETEDYPLRLTKIQNAPFALYYRGRMPEAGETLIAMVGARRASAYGKIMAEEIANSLAKAHCGVVSGMAMGVDGAAHRGCLNGGGRTYAFLGCGVDIVYPRSHQKLYEEILEHGAIISEYPPGDPPLAEHFPVRNRLIAGISQKTIVVEARRRSGSLITADFAMEQGKDVLVLPGRITDVMSEGTNQLIAQGAGIIQSIDGLIADLKDFPDLGSVSSALKTNENLNLEKEELLVYSCLDFYAKSLEEIMQESGLSLLELLSTLLRLCERGLAKETFKNQYIRLG